MKKLSDIKVVAVGGGTGLSTMLRGIKLYTQNIDVIVTVADDGGGSGIIREELHILPPGDIRNCLTALADTEPLMKELFRYRFKSGRLAGQSFGNLFLAAMCDLTGDFDTAIEKMSSVLAVTGNVLPVTKDNINLKATLKNGSVIMGESRIPEEALSQGSAISKIELVPSDARPFERCIKAIEDADIIILGPGSLYTSIIPNLIVDGISSAIAASSAKKVYVCNVMTQPGETQGYSAYDHLMALCEHMGENCIDFCIANSAPVPEDVREKYLSSNSDAVELCLEKFKNIPTELIVQDILYKEEENMIVRHDYIKLARVILSLVSDEIE